MKRTVWMGLVGVCAVGLVLIGAVAGETPVPEDWAMNATIIEACSCPMFCTCYFNTKPAAHSHHGKEEHFCRFNNAFKVNEGFFGKTDLSGARFWVAGDLGGDFHKGMDWAVLTFPPDVTDAQRQGIMTILGKLYPVEWKSFSVAEDAAMEWKASKDKAVARLNGGKTAEVVLERFPGMTDEPVVIRNLPYWGASRNEGFIMMPNKVEAYRAGEKPFEFRGTNGFMITVELSSKDAG